MKNHQNTIKNVFDAFFNCKSSQTGKHNFYTPFNICGPVKILQKKKKNNELKQLV